MSLLASKSCMVGFSEVHWGIWTVKSLLLNRGWVNWSEFLFWPLHFHVTKTSWLEKLNFHWATHIRMNNSIQNNDFKCLKCFCLWCKIQTVQGTWHFNFILWSSLAAYHIRNIRFFNTALYCYLVWNKMAACSLCTIGIWSSGELLVSSDCELTEIPENHLFSKAQSITAFTGMVKEWLSNCIWSRIILQLQRTGFLHHYN